jgi:hypothetical protein
MLQASSGARNRKVLVNPVVVLVGVVTSLQTPSFLMDYWTIRKGH